MLLQKHHKNYFSSLSLNHCIQPQYERAVGQVGTSQPASIFHEEFPPFQGRSGGLLCRMIGWRGELLIHTLQLAVLYSEGEEYALEQLHEKLGHRGIEETCRRVVLIFWWPGLKELVKT